MTRHCLVCGKTLPLLKNGTIRQHNRTMGAGRGTEWKIERCPGSHQIPRPSHLVRK